MHPERAVYTVYVYALDCLVIVKHDAGDLAGDDRRLRLYLFE
jgi:hypothetical protein